MMGVLYLIKKIRFRTRKNRYSLLSKKVLLFLVAGISIAAVGISYFLITGKTASAAWFDDSWQYRKPITITNSSGSNLTDFQVSFTLDTATLISAGKMQSDCDDIHITDINGAILPHWIEPNTPGCNDGATKIWVKMPKIYTSETVFFVYYGNSSVSNSENPQELFDFFDDFDGPLLDSALWTQVNGSSPTFSNGIMTVSSTGDPGKFILSGGTTADYYGIMASFRVTAGSSVDERIGTGVGTLITGRSLNYVFRNFTTTTTSYFLDDGVIWGSSYANNWSKNTWYTGESYYTGTTMHSRIGDDTWRSWVRSKPGTYLSLNFGSFASSASSDWDWAAVRKHTTIDPTVGSPGTEEVGPGPIAYWKFDEGADNTCPSATADACDSSGQGWDLYRNGNASWATEDMCVSGKCAYFDGDSDYFDNPDSMYLGEKFTMIAWIKVPDTTGNHYIFESEYGEPLMSISGSTLRTTLRNAADTAWVNYDASGVITANEWQHVAVTYDNSTDDVILYRNGKQVGSGSHPGPIGGYTSTQNIWIGGRATVWFKGFIDEVKIYPYARTADEIKADYIKGSSDTGSSVVLGVDDTNLSNGLVGYWKMDESAANTCSGGVNDMCDSSGNGNDGAWNGNATTATGKFGQGVTFDGTDDYVVIANSSSLNPGTGEVTVCTWAKVNSSETSYQYFYAKGDAGASTSPADLYSLGLDGSGFSRFTVRSPDGTGSYTATGTADYRDSSWHHYCGMRSGDTIRIYVDGAEEGITQNSDITLYDLGGTGGAYLSNLIEYNPASDLGGKLDELRVYNRVLSENEVKALYQWAPGPVGYYTFDEKHGSTAYDKGTLGNNGTLENSPTWTEGKYGSALDFNQTDNRVLVDSNFGIGTSNMTIATWVYIPTTSEKGAFVKIGGAQVAGKDTNYTGYAIGVGNGALEVTGNTLVMLFEGVRGINTGRALGTGWHHVAMTVNESGVPSAYLNGQLIASYAGTGPNAPVGNTKIGGYTTPTSTNRQFGGSVDDVRIYNYARTQSQIIEDMNAGHPTVGTPVGSALVHMKLDEGHGTTAHNSGSGGSSMDGSITSGTWSNDGKFGKALNTSSGYVSNISTTNDFSQSYTLSTWVNTSSFTYAPNNCADDRGYIISKLGTSGQYFDVSSISTGKFRYIHRTTAATSATVTSSVYNTDEWYHLVALYSAEDDKMELYVNGKLDGSLDTSGLSMENPTTNGVKIGYNTYNCANAYFQGKVDEVKIYPFALTAEQVQTEYNSGKTQVLGAKGTESDGTTPSNSASREYCVPGDTSTCSTPVAEFKMDEGSWSGNTAVKDTSGNENNLTHKNTAQIVSGGKLGRAGYFNGTNDYLCSDTNADGTCDDDDDFEIWTASSFTVSGWIKTSATGSKRYILAKDPASSGDPEVGIGLYMTPTGTIGFEYGSNLITYPNQSVESTSAYNDNKWHYVAYVNDPSNIFGTLYIDGQAVGTVVSMNSASASSKNFHIGRNTDGGYWSGYIDNIRLYEYARTPAQIAWDYNRGAPIAWYKLDECQGTTAFNSAVNADGTAAGNNGTITAGDTSGSNDSVGTCAGSAGEMWADGATGKINSSLEFDGTNDYVNIPQTGGLATKSEISVFAWIKTEGQTSSRGSILHSYYWGTGRRIFTLGVNQTTNLLVATAYNDATTSYGVTSPSAIPLSAWVNVGFVYDKSNSLLKLYINGVQVDSTPITGNIEQYSSNTMQIGQSSWEGSGINYFNGQIDDVRIYNYALTDQQVKQVYSNGAVSFK